MFLDPQPWRMPNARVVLVEDHEPLRILMRHLLEASGRFHIVAEATNGEQAVAATRRHRPDLVLLDLVMPVQDGRTALPEIKRAWPHARIVVHSMLQRPGLEHELRQLGAHGAIDKSASNESIIQQLSALVPPE